MYKIYGIHIDIGCIDYFSDQYRYEVRDHSDIDFTHTKTHLLFVQAVIYRRSISLMHKGGIFMNYYRLILTITVSDV